MIISAISNVIKDNNVITFANVISCDISGYYIIGLVFKNVIFLKYKRN